MIYLDYVATTPLNPQVYETYTKLLKDKFANADSMYDLGLEVELLMEKSRLLTAKMLGVEKDELIFTSGASEANNMAIKGTALQYWHRGKHVITSCIEHSSVYESFKELERVFGFEVTYLPVDQHGLIHLEDLKQALKEETILVSLMYVNNEVGTVFPIEEVKKIIKQYPKIKLHVDMVQALGKIPISLEDVDLASFSAHKIEGLKGSGLLYKKRNCQLVPLISGGQQEQGLRGGTSNACTNIVFAKTLRLALENFEMKQQHVKTLYLYLKDLIQQNITCATINTPDHDLSYHIMNVSQQGVLVHQSKMKFLECLR